MPHSVTLIHTIAAALGLALVLGFLAARLRLPALVGYLLAGVAIGPFTPGFVADAALASQLAEIGVMLLMFGGLMDEVDRIQLPDARLTQGQLYGIVNAIRLKETTYKSSGSVHGCALFQGEELLTFVEDVGRHNAIDTIAGWMWMNPETSSSGSPAEGSAPVPMSGADKVFYTTGRLTSEMVIKSAQMGVPIVVSRSGMTQMGHAVAQQLGLCAIGRATNRRFVCYSGAHRLVLQPELAQAPVVPPAQSAGPR